MQRNEGAGHLAASHIEENEDLHDLTCIYYTRFPQQVQPYSILSSYTESLILIGADTANALLFKLILRDFQ